MPTLLEQIFEEAELEFDLFGPELYDELGFHPDKLEGEVSRSSETYVRWLQRALNKVLGTTLRVDGIIGTHTRSAVRDFQRRFGLSVDGKVGPQTESILTMVSFMPPPSAPATSAPPPGGGSQSGGRGCSITYLVTSGQEYGPKFRSRRPPGLPSAARTTSASGGALSHVRRVAEGFGLGSTFVNTLAGLARTESGARFAMPANIFNALPPSRRGGKPLITAWGVFQFNRDAWRALRRRIAGSTIRANSFPWEATACEEIEYPIRRYAQLFEEIRRAGGSEFEAARGIRLWHRTPAGYSRYRRDGRSLGFRKAWDRVSNRHRSSVDRQLRRTGVL